MIEIGLSSFFVVYLLSFLAMILTLWIGYESRGKARQVEPLEQRIFRCAICTHVYLDDRDEEFSRCPLCGSLNEATPIRQPPRDRRGRRARARKRKVRRSSDRGTGGRRLYR